MLKSIHVLAILVSIAVAPFANANLITNGSFEENDIRQNSWKWFTADNVNGWSGSNIEIWDRFLGVSAVDGYQFAELNAHANGGQQFSIYQTFDTEINSLYNLTFYYQARRNTGERFEVLLNSDNTSIFSQTMDDHVRDTWSVFSGQFRAVGLRTTLTFTSLTPVSGTVGNFLDAVSVTRIPNQFQPQTSVNEPTTAVIALLSVFGFVANKVRRNSKLIK